MIYKGLSEATLSIKSTQKVMTNHEIMDLVKQRNTKIFQDICIQISHLVYQNSQHVKIEPGKPVELSLSKISVVYMKLVLDHHQAPLSFFLDEFS